MIFFSVLLFFSAAIKSSMAVSGGIGPSADYNSPWESTSTVQTSVDVRNEKFASHTKTGTTIVGLNCRDGVVLGADTRSTGGPLVMDKNKLKIHVVAPRIFCCAAGTSADCDQMTRRARHHLQLLRLERELCSEDSIYDPIQAALISVTNSLDKAQGGRKPSSVMIMGGIDDSGPSLYIIDDSTVPQRVNFASLGSGSTDAIAILESARVQWRKQISLLNSNYPNQERGIEGIDYDRRFVEDIDIETAIKTVRQAVHAGILNDLGSGSHIDICVIQKEGVRQWRESLSLEGDQSHLIIRDGDIFCDTVMKNINDSSASQRNDSGSILTDTVNGDPSMDSVENCLGEMIYRRAKLSNFLLIEKDDESIITRKEKREEKFDDNTLCYIQKI